MRPASGPRAWRGARRSRPVSALEPGPGACWYRLRGDGALLPKDRFPRAAIVTCAWARVARRRGGAAEAGELGRGEPGSAGQEAGGERPGWPTPGRGEPGRTQPEPGRTVLV